LSIVAIGARYPDIITQFLIEASTLTGIGGILGIALGIVLSLLIQMIFRPTFPFVRRSPDS
jgi:putative ABC transport system permease protein